MNRFSERWGNAIGLLEVRRFETRPSGDTVWSGEFVFPMEMTLRPWHVNAKMPSKLKIIFQHYSFINFQSPLFR